MASDLRKKFKPVGVAETYPAAEPEQSDASNVFDSSPFTPEQRQILGNVHQLILDWRRERLMKMGQPTPVALPAEREV